YGVEIHDDNSLYITDTFKGRVLEIDYINNKYKKIYQGARTIIVPKAHAKVQHNSCAKLMNNIPEGFVRNETSNKRLDKNQIIKIKLDYLPKIMKSLDWHPTYNGFVNVETGRDL